MKRLRHNAVKAVLLATTCALNACSAFHEGGGAGVFASGSSSDALPTLERIKRHDLPDVVDEKKQQVALTAHVLRIELPVDAVVEDLWALTDEDVAAPVVVEAWHLNGMRIGVLDEATIPEFIEKLPPAVASRRNLIATQREALTPLYRSPSIAGAVTVDLTVPPLAPKQETYRHGNAQLLGRVVRELEDHLSVSPLRDRVNVELVPHHHRVKSTLHPRMPQEKLLDGRVFDEFAMNLALQRGERVVIGLYRELQTQAVPQAEEPSDGAGDVAPDAEREGAESDDTPPADEPVTSEPTAEEQGTDENDTKEDEPPLEPVEAYVPLPDHLGRHMLTGRRLTREVQVLLILTFEEEPTPAPVAAQPAS